MQQALSEGININITLIFAIENYRQVAAAYPGALEERTAKGQDIGRISSMEETFPSARLHTYPAIQQLLTTSRLV